MLMLVVLVISAVFVALMVCLWTIRANKRYNLRQRNKDITRQPENIVFLQRQDDLEDLRK